MAPPKWHLHEQSFELSIIIFSQYNFYGILINDNDSKIFVPYLIKFGIRLLKSKLMVLSDE